MKKKRSKSLCVPFSSEMCIHLIPLETGSPAFDKEQRWNLCFASSPTHGKETLGVKENLYW